MTRTKGFDCVAMKAQVQDQLRKESVGMTEDEARRRQWQRVLSDPILRTFLASVTARTSVQVK
jgi:hypothetical protein